MQLREALTFESFIHRSLQMALKVVVFLVLPTLALFMNSVCCFTHSNMEGSTLMDWHEADPSHGSTSAAYPSYFDLDEEYQYDQANRFLADMYGTSKRLVLNVDDYGAKGDGRTDDSQAFVKAWKKACTSATSATLLVPQNKNYLLKPVAFSGPCKSDILVMIKGTIEASSNRGDWNSENSRYWIRFSNIQHLTVQGGGTFNGNGKIWWQKSCKTDASLPCKTAPTALHFYKCNNLMVENLEIQDSQQIHVSFESCNNVVASGLSISAPEKSPNTDGIHVTNTQNIQIKNCVIKTGDDCISIVSGSRNVKATNTVCGPGHGISIGSLGADNSKDYVSDVVVDTAQLSGTTNGVRIKTWQGGRGYAKNITFSNISMRNVQNPIIIDQNYCDSKKPCQQQKSAVAVKDISYVQITGTSASDVAIRLDCSTNVPCQGIILKNIKLVKANGDATKSFCQKAYWRKVGSVVPPPCG